VIVWIALAPTQLGGQVSYVIVDGTSMQPNFHLGDLVLVRTESTYQVGDAVTYWNAELGTFVFHRIVGLNLDHFILKGDNNSWNDTYQPTQSEIVGKLWVHIPELGLAIEWAHVPINAALTFGLLGGFLMTTMLLTPSQNKRGKSRLWGGNMGGALEGALYLMGFLALAFLGLTILAFTRPLTRTADGIKYQQDGYFYYSAPGTPGVYDSDKIQTGEPIFPKLNCSLNVGVLYTLSGSSLEGIFGTHQLYALILDEQSGWQRAFAMDSQATFNSNPYILASSIDLCQVESLVGNMEQQTGMHSDSYTLKIIDHMNVMGLAAGQPINDTFDPSLVFKFDSVHFYLDTNTATDSPLHSSKAGLAGAAGLQANTLPLLGLNPTVLTVRVLALFGFILMLGGLLILGWAIFDAVRQNEPALIQLKYGSLLMNVYERTPYSTSRIIDVASIDDLARLAERQNTMIMHMTLNFLHFYLVQCNGITYRYVVSTGKRGFATLEPAPIGLLNDGFAVNPRRVLEVQPIQYQEPDNLEVTARHRVNQKESVWSESSRNGFNPDTNSVVPARPLDNEMLGKIKM
jgi:signal peptidase I